MDSPSVSHSYGKKEGDGDVDLKTDKAVDHVEYEGTEKKKHRSSKSRQQSSGDDSEDFDGSGRKRSSGDRYESRKRSGGSKQESDEDDYESRRESRSKQSKKKQEESSLEKLSTWYQDGDLENRQDGGDKLGSRGHGQGSDDSDKRKGKQSDHGTSQSKSRSKQDRHQEMEPEKSSDRDSKYSEKRESREKGHGSLENVKGSKRRLDDTDSVNKVDDSTYDKVDEKGSKASDIKHDNARERSASSRNKQCESKSKGVESSSDKGVRSNRRDERRPDGERSRNRSVAEGIEEDEKASPSTHDDRADKEKNEQNREPRTPSGRDAADSRDRFLHTDEDGCSWSRDRSGRGRRSMTPDRGGRYGRSDSERIHGRSGRKDGNRGEDFNYNFTSHLSRVLLGRGLPPFMDLRELSPGDEIAPAIPQPNEGRIINVSSASTSHQNSYDVFLSFRGEDTRYTFISHLYSALSNRGIYTFIDDKLRQGQELEPALVQAMDNSRIAIVVFSENYANSSWCLDELVKILECKELMGQIVVPVFYKVDPSDVRKQSGNFAEALTRHEDRMQNPEKAKTWKVALSKAANLSGWHLKSNDSEAEFIEDIVKEVLSKVDNELLHVTDNMVGMESHVKVMSSLLAVGSNDVRMIGICGMGGIGKTTIAKTIYNLFKLKFEFSEFLMDVRETCQKSSQSGLVQLQETLLSKIIWDDELKLRNVDRGINVIKRRLCKKQVLVVIDDVNHLKQLETLAGACDWFGCGSRIIITTRDEHLLVAHGLKKIYNVRPLNDRDAFCLFSLVTFQNLIPEKNYFNLSREVIRYARGLPLAVKVLGSFLRGRSLSEWISAIEKLKRVPNREILSVLEISFESLDDFEKAIFLDFACFFKGYPVDYVKEVLESCGLYPESGMPVLVDKCLITTKFGIVDMHDMIEEMGKDIVRRGSSEEPGERTRLWFHEDVLDVLAANTGTSNIQGIKLDLAAPEDVCFSNDAFINMKRLRLLIVCNVIRSGGDSLSLPNGLRWLEWPEYTIPSLPFGSGQKKLVRLCMSKSSIKLLGEELKLFHNLRFVDFRHSTFLSRLPDLSSLQNLESLNLSECKSLTEVHDSLGLLEKLIHLNFLNCCNLSSFASSLRSRPLQSMILKGCLKLSTFPDILVEVKGMKELSLDETAIDELPHSSSNFVGLKRLYLKECKKLKSLPSSIYKMQQLEYLYLSGCSQFEKFPDFGDGSSADTGTLSLKLSTFPDILVEVKGMKELSLDETAIDELPHSISNLVGLKGLYLKECKKLKSLPSSIYKMQQLEYLYLSGCSQFEKFPDNGEGSSADTGTLSLPAFPNLIYLDLRGCNLSEVNFLNGLQCASTLTVLNLSENKFIRLPEDISRFTKLQQLNLTNCNHLQEILELPPNISHLFAEGCECLESYAPLSNMLQSPPSQSSLLRRIELFGCDKLNPQGINVHKMLSVEELLGKARVDIFHPGSEVPKWFLYHSAEETLGNHITEGLESQVTKWFHLHSTERLLRFEVPSNLYPKIAGLAFCAVAATQDHSNISCDIQLFVNKQRTYGFVENFPSLKSDHLWLSYIPRNLMWGLDAKLTPEGSRFGVLFKVLGAVLGSCAVHVVCHLEEKQHRR